MDWNGCWMSSIISTKYEITNDETDFITSNEIQEWLELGKYGITMKKFGIELKQHILHLIFK